MKSFFYLQKNWETLLVAVIGFFAIIIYTSYNGIGVSPDSIVYASVARNLHNGKGFIEFSGLPIVQFPVFFPAFLGVIFFISGVDSVIAAPYLNGILFAAVIFCCGSLIDQFQHKNRWYKRFMLMLIVLSPSLLEIYKMIWSETLFILLSVIFLLNWQSYVRTHQLKRLLFLALIGAVAVITRYAGITLIFTGSLLLLIDPLFSIKQKIKHFLLFNLVAVSLLIINLVRNAIILGTTTGNRQKGTTSFTDNLQYFGTTISSWLSIPEDKLSLAFFIGITSILGFLVLLGKRSRQKLLRVSIENALVCFFLIYVAFIIITSTISRYETINNRLLAPAFIPFLLGGTSWLISTLKKYRQKQYLVSILLISVVSILVSFYTDYQQYRHDTTTGIPGYTDINWNKSETVSFLKKHEEIFKPDLKIFSNASEGVYFFTDFKSFSLPDRHYSKEIKDYSHEKPNYVVWFDQTEDEELLTLPEINRIKPLKLLYHFKDGAIYKSP